MKLFLKYITLQLLLLLTACTTPEPVPQGSLTVTSGISSNTLSLDGAAGSQTTFTISSKLPWTLLETEGVTFNPSSGEADDNIKIVATATSANNSLESRKLGDIVFRLASTRFTGLEAHQRPQIIIGSELNDGVIVTAEQGKVSTLKFETKCDDIEVETSGDIACAFAGNSNILTIVPTKDNMSMDRRVIGEIFFKVNGIKQAGSIDVMQRQAILFNHKRVLVNGTIGATMDIAAVTPFDFSVTSSSEDFSVARGTNNTIVVTANCVNNTSTENKIGVLTVTLTDNTASKATIEVWQRTAQAEQSIMLFFLGTSLSSYYKSNIDMISKALEADILGNRRVIAFTQTTQYAGQLSELRYDKAEGGVVREQLREYSLPYQYTDQTIYSIFEDMITTAPAKSYALITGAHGKGWLPKAGGGASGSKMATAAFDKELLIWTPAPGAAAVRHIGDSSTTQFDTTQIAAAITRNNIKLDYIIFDVCYMSNIEAIYDLKDATKYVLASPCEILASGMPYDKIIPYLLTEKDTQSALDTSALAFVDYYTDESKGIYASACAAVTDCSRVEALASSVKAVNTALKDVDPGTIQYFDGVDSYYNPTHIFFDLEDYILQSCTDSAAVAAFVAELDKTLSGQYHTETFYSAYNNKANPITTYCGVTTSAPITLDSASAYIDEWKQTAWYKATH